MFVKSSLLPAAFLFFAASSLSVNSFAQDNPSYQRTRTRPVIPYKHATLAAPPGMVYIPGGVVTIKYSQSSTDTNSKKKVSLSSFYIDKTEVTNQQYRMFTNWVIDSIAVVEYLKDDKYFLDNPQLADKKGKKGSETAQTTTPTASTDSNGALTTTTSTTPVDSIQFSANTPTAPSAAAPIPGSKDTTKGRRRLNWANINHQKIFESNDEEIKAKIAPMFDATTGKIRKELYVFPFTYLRATGTNVGVKPGEYATERINIYPDEQIWFKDINNAQVEILVENYFTAPPYDDYPVVGVNWKQARAFAYWRSATNPDFAYIADYLKYYRLQYTLPSEAQWVYAAGKDMGSLIEKQKSEKDEDAAAEAKAISDAHVADSMALVAANAANAPAAGATDSVAAMAAANPDAAPVDSNATGSDEKVAVKEKGKKKKSKKKKGNDESDAVAVKKSTDEVDRDKDGKLLINFKQGEGDYTEDGSNFTLPVMAYAPNELGVYNMIGNVAEWVLDAYSPSTFAFVSDVNPVLLYDADSTDADAMKRKVVRGGSFMSNAKALGPFSRDFELQDKAHCYIGFRCVMSAPDILSRSVATRRRTTITEKKAK